MNPRAGTVCISAGQAGPPVGEDNRPPPLGQEMGGGLESLEQAGLCGAPWETWHGLPGPKGHRPPLPQWEANTHLCLFMRLAQKDRRNTGSGPLGVGSARKRAEQRRESEGPMQLGERLLTEQHQSFSVLLSSNIIGSASLVLVRMRNENDLLLRGEKTAVEQSIYKFIADIPVCT